MNFNQVYSFIFLLFFVSNAFAQKKTKLESPVLEPCKKAVKISNYDSKSTYQYAFNPFFKPSIQSLTPNQSEVSGDRVFVRAIKGTDTTKWEIGNSIEFKKLPKPIKKLMVYYCGENEKDKEFADFEQAMTKFLKKINWSKDKDFSIVFIDPNDLKGTFFAVEAESVLFYANKTSIKSSNERKNLVKPSLVAQKLLKLNYSQILIIFDSVHNTSIKGSANTMEPIKIDTTFTTSKTPPIFSDNYFAYIPYERDEGNCKEPFYQKLFITTDIKEKKFLLLDQKCSTMEIFLKELAVKCCSESKKEIQNNIIYLSQKIH